MEGRPKNERAFPAHETGARETEKKKTPKEMRNALLLRFHPDIDGLPPGVYKVLQENPEAMHIIALAEQAEKNDPEAIRALETAYAEHVLRTEDDRGKLVEERKKELAIHIARLREYMRLCLFEADEEKVREAQAAFEKEWAEMSARDREAYEVIRVLRDAALPLREAFETRAKEEKWLPGGAEEMLRQMADRLDGELAKFLVFVEGDVADPLLVTRQIEALLHAFTVERQALLQPKHPPEESTQEEKTDQNLLDDGGDDYEEEKAEASNEPAVSREKEEAPAEETSGVSVAPVVALAAYQVFETREGDKKVILTKDRKHIDHLEIMAERQLVQGYEEVRDEQGNYRFVVTSQVLPWCAAPREEFFLKNKHHHGLFPRALRGVKRPGSDEFFPEAVFLDDTGTALRAYVRGDWRQYLASAEYARYLAKFDYDPNYRVDIPITERPDW